MTESWLNWLMVQEFQKEKVEPVRKMCDETRRLGQALIQSAAAGVSTTDVECNLQTLNTAWTTLSDRVCYLITYLVACHLMRTARVLIISRRCIITWNCDA